MPDINVKKLFASMETSGDISGDWLQLQRSTFEDLKRRGKLRKDLTFEQLSDPKNYDEAADAHIKDLQTTFGIPTVELASFYNLAPAYYEKYEGDWTKIPDPEKVWRNRYNNLMKHLRGE